MADKPKKESSMSVSSTTGWWNWTVTWYDENGKVIGTCSGSEPTRDAAKQRIKEHMNEDKPCNSNGN